MLMVLGQKTVKVCIILTGSNFLTQVNRHTNVLLIFITRQLFLHTYRDAIRRKTTKCSALFFGTWCHNFLLWATYVEVLKMSRPPLALAIIIYHLSSIVRTIYNSLNYLLYKSNFWCSNLFIQPEHSKHSSDGSGLPEPENPTGFWRFSQTRSYRNPNFWGFTKPEATRTQNLWVFVNPTVPEPETQTRGYPTGLETLKFGPKIP